MIGIKFIKVQPTTYLLQYRGGQVVREGLGLSFFYYAFQELAGKAEKIGQLNISPDLLRELMAPQPVRK
jgi:hypothetical protein